MDYVHFNPVNHGYVTFARDWPFSTFRCDNCGHHFLRDRNLLSAAEGGREVGLG